MTEWTGEKLANYLQKEYGTSDPIKLAKIYGFNFRYHNFDDSDPAFYIAGINGRKDIYLSTSIPNNQIPFYIGQQLGRYLLYNPDQIEKGENNGII